MSNEELRSGPTPLAIAAIACIAYALCDTLHELAHLAMTLLPLGVQAVSISAIGLSTDQSSAWVALAGPLANLLLATSLMLSSSRTLPAAWRWFAWLFGTVNLFDATAYLIYSGLLGSGDWAVVFNAVTTASLWRPVAGLLGCAAYAAAVVVSARGLRGLVASSVVAISQIERYCTTSYWAGGLLLTAAAALNPVSPWFILTSGAATGFGAMAGVLLLPHLLKRSGTNDHALHESLRIGPAWQATGIATAILFVVVFGRGIAIAT